MSTSIQETLARLAGAAHRGGAFDSSVLLAIAEVLPDGPLRTLETGCGKSTIMFSNLSARHLVFAYDDRNLEGSSVDMVQQNSDFRADVTTFVYGPTQQTLPRHQFADDDLFDVILIDGPHGYPFPDLEYALLYERLKPGAILILDDVHIPSIGRMYDILREDRMYEEVGVFATTGLLKRTALAGVPGDGDHWYEQSYNFVRFPLSMERYHSDRTVLPGTRLDLSDAEVLARHAVKSIEPADARGAAWTVDIGATLELMVPPAAADGLEVEIEYRSARPDACGDATVAIAGQSFPLPSSTGWTSLRVPVAPPASGRITITFLHPLAIPEHDRQTKRYEFRRIGSYLRAVTLHSTAAGAVTAARPRPRGLMARLAAGLRR